MYPRHQFPSRRTLNQLRMPLPQAMGTTVAASTLAQNNMAEAEKCETEVALRDMLIASSHEMAYTQQQNNDKGRFLVKLAKGGMDGNKAEQYYNKGVDALMKSLAVLVCH